MVDSLLLVNILTPALTVVIVETRVVQAPAEKVTLIVCRIGDSALLYIVALVLTLVSGNINMVQILAEQLVTVV